MKNRFFELSHFQMYSPVYGELISDGKNSINKNAK
jgi:hypothetical protein